MNIEEIIPVALTLAAISVAVIVGVARSILREINGLGDEDGSQAARRTEERKNERIRKEIEQRREEEP